MTSAPQPNAPQQAPPAKPANNTLRIVLFAILGYMVFALIYDYTYVFKAHEEKFQELTELVTKETQRSADDLKEKGPFGPKQVQEAVGFGPSVPLEDKGHYLHERYTYRRGLPFLTRDIDVFYKKHHGSDQPGIYSVAHSKEEVEQATPAGAVEPNKDVGTETPADKKGTSDEKTPEVSPEPPAGETPSETPAAEDKKETTPAAEKTETPATESTPETKE